MVDISDDELFTLALEENEDAKNILYDRFKFIIDLNIKKYQRIAKSLGIDMKDFECEALYGFSDALASYRQERKASIPTFINLCIDRRIKKYLIKASRKKNKFEKEAFSLDYVYEDLGMSLLDILSDERENDPLLNITKNEDYEELLNMIEKDLSKLELQVFKLMIEGFNYQQIAVILKKDPKQIDNAMQRIKNKIKIILKKRIKD